LRTEKGAWGAATGDVVTGFVSLGDDVVYAGIGGGARRTSLQRSAVDGRQAFQAIDGKLLPDEGKSVCGWITLGRGTEVIELLSV
jgi:hypothetical protein